MTIASGGSVTLDSGQYLTVTGTITNNNGTSGLIINDGGSLIYGSGTPSGTIYRLMIHGTASWNDHFISSPVESTTIGNVFSSMYWNNIFMYSYNEPGGAWVNQYYYNPMNPGTGYSVWIDPAIPDQTATFSGTLNPDGVPQTLTYTASQSESGWNLIGNPYSSAIDWGYIYSHYSNWSGKIDDQIDIWDQGSYLAGTSVINNIIPAQSGFFVHVTSASTPSVSETLPWAARVHNNHSLYKDVVPDLLHLYIAGNNLHDNTYIQFTPGATSGFDSEYDAQKLWGLTTAPQLFSIIPGDSLAINALPSVESDPIVLMGLKVGADSTYTITADGMNSFDPSVPIFLDDLKLDVTTNLRTDTVYSFEAAPGDPINRFRVRFAYPVGIGGQKSINIFTYGDNGKIVLNDAGNYEGTYYVYNMTGQLMTTLQMQPGIEYTRLLPAGMYIVKIATCGTIISRKVVLL